MKIQETSIAGVLIIETDVFGDNRGSFMESYHMARYKKKGILADFVQDNISRSVKGTLRGLHYQVPHQQAKLVYVVKGEIFDVALDIRSGSPTFGKWTGVTLSEDNHRQLFIPEGFAHGFCVLSESAVFEYKCSDFYSPESEGGILWSDPDLAIDWPIKAPLLSEKDSVNPCLRNVPKDRLPQFTA